MGAGVAVGRGRGVSVLRDYAAEVSRPTLDFDAPFDDALPPTRYDEMVDDSGDLRSGWKTLATRALALTSDDLQRVGGEITRFLADDGVSYMRGDSGVEPWQLDPMPLVVDAASWARLDVGLAQRAELLNAVLVDLYGPQSLLRERIVPSAVVYGHSGFVRPMGRTSAFDPHPLLLSASDLGRSADGEWHVLADRVQAPSGLGFAAENRRVLSQVLPDLYQEGDLHRLEPYLAAVRAALLSSATAHRDASGPRSDPRIVILSPGTLSETAFDQAFLAGALGFPLVQGSDLVVHEGWVWMKPSGWPATRPTERIDVIIRRVDAAWCDPLELRADSRLGVAGLAEAARRGRVRLVNGLGAGVLENPALMPYLGAACEHLLGEQLRIPSVTTWWCGDPHAFAAVRQRVADGDPSLFVRLIDEPRKSLAGLTRDQLLTRLDAAPHRYVGQDVLPLSQVPVWSAPGRVAPRAMTLRTFTLRYGSSYRPLVGGLATVRESPESTPTTKDVWVLKAAESDADQGLAEIHAPETSRTVPTLAPRALSDMFWIGRYAERTEDLLRLLLTTQAEFDQPGVTAGNDRSARVLLAALHRLAESRWEDPEAEFRSLLLDTARAGSAAHSISRLRDAMEGVRDQLSGDTWRVFSNIERAARALRVSPHPHRTAESAGRMLAAILSLYGVTANMIRDSGWHMIGAGRHLERGLQLCQLLAVGATERRDLRGDREVLEALLRASESVVTYRRRYRGSTRTADVLDLLLLDPDNPRSLRFALAETRRHLAQLPSSTGSSRPERLLEHLETELDQTDVAELSTVAGGQRPRLAAYLEDVIAQLEQLAGAVTELHFESGPPPMSLSELSLVELMETRS